MKTGIVLEGGALRGIFTSGVVDCFLMHDMHFDYAIGVSAGAGNITSLKSRQIGRTANVMAAPKGASYFGMTELIHSKQYLNLDKMFDANGKYPLDFEKLFADKTEAEYTVCCCESGEAEYMSEGEDAQKLLRIIKASCALPMFFAPIEIDSKHYLDGGIGDSIPCRRAIERGCDKLIVVLTKPEGTAPGEYSKYMRIIKHMYSEYPKLWEACEKRLDRYNESFEYMKRLESDGKAIVIRPRKNISKFEKDNTKLRSYYKHGYDAALSNMKNIREFLRI